MSIKPDPKIGNRISQPKTAADRYAAKLRMLELQAAFRSSDLQLALALTDKPILPADGGANVFRLWSEMENPSVNSYRWQEAYNQIRKLYKFLRTSVDITWLNRRDPVDGARPIDVAGQIQTVIMLDYKTTDGLDCNPTETHFPLCRSFGNLKSDRICEIIDTMNPELLDEYDPSTDQTPLHMVVGMLSVSPKDYLPILLKLAEKIPYINPFKSFTDEITTTEDGVEIVRVMRLEYSAYRRRLPSVVAQKLVSIPSVVLTIVFSYV